MLKKVIEKLKVIASKSNKELFLEIKVRVKWKKLAFNPGKRNSIDRNQILWKLDHKRQQCQQEQDHKLKMIILLQTVEAYQLLN
jgi:hypothetical protein